MTVDFQLRGLRFERVCGMREHGGDEGAGVREEGEGVVEGEGSGEGFGARVYASVPVLLGDGFRRKWGFRGRGWRGDVGLDLVVAYGRKVGLLGFLSWWVWIAVGFGEAVE